MSTIWEYNNQLYHHGIKGMKWGVRRYETKDGHLTPAGKKRYDDGVVKGMKYGVKKKHYKEHMDEDRVLKKGTKIQNISKNEKRDLSRGEPVYGAYTKYDKNAYAGKYASGMEFMGDKAIKNTIQITNDIKVPSQKKAAEIFMDMYKNDPEGVSKSIGKAYAELDFFNNIDKIRNYNAARITKKYNKKGEDWIASKGYLLFNQSMMSTKESKARNEYYSILRKKGYGAISDINDVQTGYNTDDPIIFINPKKTMKNIESRQLTYDEIELAEARYNYDSAVKNRSLVNDLIYEDYRKSKNELKRVEKKQGLR